METVQIFETTVADREHGYAFRFLTIPQRSLSNAIQNNEPPAKDVIDDVFELQSSDLEPPLYPIRPHLLSSIIYLMQDSSAIGGAYLKRFISIGDSSKGIKSV